MLLPRAVHHLMVSVTIWADDSQLHITSPTWKTEPPVHIPNGLPLACLPSKFYIKACPPLQLLCNYLGSLYWHHCSPSSREAQFICIQHPRPDSSFRVSPRYMPSPFSQGPRLDPNSPLKGTASSPLAMHCHAQPSFYHPWSNTSLRKKKLRTLRIWVWYFPRKF